MKHYKMTFRSCLAIIMMVVITCASSCSSHRKANVATAPGRVTAKRSTEVATLTETYKPWQIVQMPFTLRCSSPANVNLSGRATMVYGECIHLSLRMIGLEVAQVWVDTDSVFVSEKLGKTLVAEPLSRLTAHTGLNISDLQSLLLGQAFYPGTGTLNDASKASTQFSVTHDGDEMIMTPRRTPAGVTWYFTIETGPQLGSVTVEPDGMKPFKAFFSDFVDTPAGMSASDVLLSGEAMSKTLDAGFYWNQSKASWDNIQKPSKPTWKGYRRMEARQMLEALKKAL